MKKKVVKKKITISEPKRANPSRPLRPDGRAKKTALADHDINKVRKPRPQYVGEDPHVVIIPDAVPDPEETALSEEKEEFDLSEWKGDGPHPFKLYPPPKNSKVFRRKWREFIENVCDRENFRKGHLSQLEILCDLYVEYEALTKFVRTRGYTYVAIGRQGKVTKTFPEVLQLNKVLIEIRNYSKILGLVLKKDDSTGNSGESEEWD